MVKKIRFYLQKNIYFTACGIAFFLFLLLIWFVRKHTVRELDEYAQATTQNIALGNINIVSGVIDDYARKLSWLKIAVESGNEFDLDKNEIISKFIEQDTIISDIKIQKSNNIDEKSNLYIERDSLLCFSLPLQITDCELVLIIPLKQLHARIASDEKLLQAYTTITLGGRYVFHPDENLLGTNEKSTEIGVQNNVLLHHKKSTSLVYSDYLEMFVYRYYRQHYVNNQELVCTANIPNLGIKERTQKTLDAFLILFLCGIVIFVFIFLLGFLRWRTEFVKRKEVEHQNLSLQLKNEKQKQIVTASKLEILKSGLNPHFLFNSLGSLMVLVEKQPKLASDFSMKLSNVYRYLLKHENRDKVTVAEELTFVEDYIALQKIRFADRIIIDMNLNNSILQEKIPPVSIQLLVENCIKHTIISATNPLEISIYEALGYIVVTNNYNPRMSEIEHSGKGIDNLVKRYSLLTSKRCYFYVEGTKYVAKIPLLL